MVIVNKINSTPLPYIQNFDSDDDVSYEVENYDDQEIELSVQERINPILNNFNQFLKEPTFINPVGDLSTRLINLTSGIPYNIPDAKINKFFRYMEAVRRKKISGIMWSERQYFHPNDYSGIMIDLDIYQSDANSQFTDVTYNMLFQHISRIFKQYLNIEEHICDNGKSIEIHMAAIRRPKITKFVEKSEVSVVDSEQSTPNPDIYKDGIHILIPGIKVQKAVKRLLIDKIRNKDADIFKYIKVVNEKYKPVGKYDSKDDATPPVNENMSYRIIDTMSSSVPVFLYGCVRERTRPPYVLDRFIEMTIPVITDVSSTSSYKLLDPMITDISKKYGLFDEDMSNSGISMPTANWSQEFSLHWEGQRDPVIIKHNYELRSEYKKELEKYSANAEKELIADDRFGDLDIRKINDPEIDFIQKLIDTLSPHRSVVYELWFDVICALAHVKSDMKPIAQYFSQKCSLKYKPLEFEKFWMQAKKDKKNCLNLGSICMWAKEDNPVRYKEVCDRRVFTIILKKVYDGITEGMMSHFDIAEILYRCLPYKYTYSYDIGGLWYEFVTEDDDHRDGEIFKWRSIPGHPPSLRNYISVVLPSVFKQVLRKIEDNYKAANQDDAGYHFSLKKNFQNSCRRLGDSTFKNNVIREAQDIYRDINFSDKLNKYTHVLPVANGVLVLGEKVRLLRGYHNYLVSNFAPADFMQFDPRHPMIKKVLYIYRNLFPDNEPDTHELFMLLYASSLDAGKKESIFAVKVGGGKNGKTMTTEMHRNTLGHKFAVTLPIQFITVGPKRDAEASSPATMKAEFARTVDYQESDKCETLSASKMKLITGQGAIGGRENFGEYRTFLVAFNNIVDTNYEFTINDNSHGTWRRMLLINMRMKFFHPHEMDNFDPKSPFHRIAVDVDQNDPEYISAYLSVMVWYYEQLQKKYSGKVLNAPHPNIERATNSYRGRQDKLDYFLDKFLIKCAKDEKDTELLLEEVIGRYERWYKTFGVLDNDFRKTIMGDLQNSRIQNLIEKDTRGMREFLRGYRICEPNASDDLRLGEKWHNETTKKSGENKLFIESETTDEYYQKVCREYDEEHAKLLIALKMPVVENKYDLSLPQLSKNEIDKMRTIGSNTSIAIDLNEILNQDEISRQARNSVNRREKSQKDIDVAVADDIKENNTGGSSSNGDNNGNSDGDGDNNGNSDSDSDGDSDGDNNGDGDSDSDNNGDSDSENSDDEPEPIPAKKSLKKKQV